MGPVTEDTHDTDCDAFIIEPDIIHLTRPDTQHTLYKTVIEKTLIETKHMSHFCLTKSQDMRHLSQNSPNHLDMSVSKQFQSHLPLFLLLTVLNVNIVSILYLNVKLLKASVRFVLMRPINTSI